MRNELTTKKHQQIKSPNQTQQDHAKPEYINETKPSKLYKPHPTIANLTPKPTKENKQNKKDQAKTKLNHLNLPNRASKQTKGNDGIKSIQTKPNGQTHAQPHKKTKATNQASHIKLTKQSKLIRQGSQANREMDQTNFKLDRIKPRPSNESDQRTSNRTSNPTKQSKQTEQAKPSQVRAQPNE